VTVIDDHREGAVSPRSADMAEIGSELFVIPPDIDT
jgi:hypothetical protein